MVDDLYMQELIQKFKSPEHSGKLSGATIYSAHVANTSCGDVLTLYLKIEKGKICDVKFAGEGCLISQVQADLLCEDLLGKRIEDARKVTKEYVLGLINLRVSPSRLKCAWLAFEALKVILEDI